MRILLLILLITTMLMSMTCRYGLKFDNQKITDGTLRVYGKKDNRMDSLGSVGAYTKGIRFVKLDGSKDKVIKLIASYDSIVVMGIQAKPDAPSSRWAFHTTQILENMKLIVLH